MVLNEPKTVCWNVYCRIFGQFEFNLELSALIRNAMFMPPHTMSLPPQYQRCLKIEQHLLDSGVQNICEVLWVTPVVLLTFFL